MGFEWELTLGLTQWLWLALRAGFTLLYGPA